MRQEEAQAQVPHSYTTARTLLSILRLSQALARLRFSDYVCQVGSTDLIREVRESKWETACWGHDQVVHGRESGVICSRRCCTSSPCLLAF